LCAIWWYKWQIIETERQLLVAEGLGLLNANYNIH
jgi:hypothetical protein